MNQTIQYYNENAKEFCKDTRDADMSFCRNKFLALLDKKMSIANEEDNRQSLDAIENQRKRHILDAGCGSGRDAKAFLELGYRIIALDASERICEEAERLIGQKVLCMPFEEINFREEFDGIWACASLLHITEEKMDDVLQRFWTALKRDGLLYASFKYGEGEQVAKGRFFHYYREETLEALMKKNHFCIKEIFITQDVRQNRENEKWVNILAEKRDSIGLQS